MGLGPGEIVLILVIAYVVVGPEDMSKLARTLAKGLRELRKLGADLKSDVGDSIPLQSLSARLQENDPLQPLTDELQKNNPLQPLTAEVKKNFSLSDKKSGSDTPLPDIRKETEEDLESVMNEILKAEELMAAACTDKQGSE